MLPRHHTQDRSNPNQVTRSASGQRRSPHFPNIMSHKRAPQTAPSPASSRQNMSIAEKLISDCYSKRIIDNNGKPIIENSYQAHVLIKEFSSFPTRPPPPDLKNGELGSVKDRVLVICVKYSNRVLLQKGKYNESKDLYQIGRTWDFDELRLITKIGNNGIILSLNKDYYWEFTEGSDAMFKFIRIMTKTYGKFIGKYPDLIGFTLEEFRLPPHPSENARAPADITRNKDTQQEKNVRPIKNSDHGYRALSPNFNGSKSSISNTSDPYKHFDFTSNGKLPSKPMKVMSVDRPSNNTYTSMIPREIDTSRNHKEIQSPRAVHEARGHSENLEKAYEGGASSKLDETKFKENTSIVNSTTSNSAPSISRTSLSSRAHKTSTSKDSSAASEEFHDTSSFVFKPSNTTYSPEKLQEYSRNTEGGSTSPLRKYRPRNPSDSANMITSEPIESSAALGLELEKQLENLTSDTILSNKNNPPLLASKGGVAPVLSDTSPDFGIEEVQDLSDDNDDINKSLKENDSTIEQSNNPKTEIGLGILNSQNETSMTNGNAEGSKLEEFPSLSSDKISPNNNLDIITGFKDSETETELEKSSSMSSTYRSRMSSAQRAQTQTQASDSNLFEVDDEHISSVVSDESFPSKRSYSVDANSNSQIKQSGKYNDPEIEEFLEDILWTSHDDSDTLIKKITKELNNLKLNKIDSLINLDFSKDLDDVGRALEEADNLRDIFSKMEINFKLLEPEVNLIEADSNGVQVKYINKKLLFNDLNNILSEVSMSKSDLIKIENFQSFDSIDELSDLESKLLNLFNAFKTLNQTSSEDNRGYRLKALQQYQIEYQEVSNSFSTSFLNEFKQLVCSITKDLETDIERFHIGLLTNQFDRLLNFCTITYFLKSVSNHIFFELQNTFNGLFSRFFIKLIEYKVKNMRSSSSSVGARLSQTIENSSPHKRSSSSRVPSRRENLLGKISSVSNHKKESPETNFLHSGNSIDDPRLIIGLLNETKDIILSVQYFITFFFHTDDRVMDFDYYFKHKPDRNLSFSELKFKEEDFIYSDEMMVNLNSIFSGYTTALFKKVVPAELNIPVVLSFLDTLLKDSKKKNLEFLVFSVLMKIEEKFKSNWMRFIEQQVSSIEKTVVIADCGILPSIKRACEVIILTGSSLDVQVFDSRASYSDIASMMMLSYSKISDSLVHILTREDPLLKNHQFYEKELNHKNISIIQNSFYILEQLSVLSFGNMEDITMKFKKIYEASSKTYLDRLLEKNISKIAEFVNNYENVSDLHGDNKYNKKYMKNLIHTYSHKEIVAKIQEMVRKIEKHFSVEAEVYEKDLVAKLRGSLEMKFIDYFRKFDAIMKKEFNKEVDSSVSISEITSIFKSVR